MAEGLIGWKLIDGPNGISAVHEGKKPFKCDICDTNFAQSHPVLPPKINNVNSSSRQRRHSDTVTSVTEGSPDLLNDPIVQERLRPRNNSVTNALYDRYVIA